MQETTTRLKGRITSIGTAFGFVQSDGQDYFFTVYRDLAPGIRFAVEDEVYFTPAPGKGKSPNARNVSLEP